MSTEDIKQLVARVTSANHDFSRKFVIPEIDTAQSLEPESAWVRDSLDCKPSKLDREEKELADIILWMLGEDSISSRKIQQKVGMGNRAYGIIEKLFQMNLVTGKSAKQPRVVIPKSVDEIPVEVMGFLSKNEISVEDIDSAFQGRS